jgi:hypothetical protein
MKCPHCSVHFHEEWGDIDVAEHLNADTDWGLRITACPACEELTIELGKWDATAHGAAKAHRVFPTGANRGPVPPEVPPDIAQDYKEACLVLLLSPKASAALSRRCLQNMLHQNEYKAKDLAKEIDLLLNEKDATKALPQRLRVTVDGIRNFGNFSAHPIDDKTTLQVIDVEPDEAEWCVETIEELFEHFYVAPAAAKAKKAKLDAKLVAAGKPPSKQHSEGRPHPPFIIRISLTTKVNPRHRGYRGSSPPMVRGAAAW